MKFVEMISENQLVTMDDTTDVSLAASGIVYYWKDVMHCSLLVMAIIEAFGLKHKY